MAWGDGERQGNEEAVALTLPIPPCPSRWARQQPCKGGGFLPCRASAAQPVNITAPTYLGLRFEDRVPLLAGLGDFPDPLEARGYDEGVACAQFVFPARDRLYAHAAFDDHAEFVLGVTHAPFAGGAGPDAAEELLGRLGVLIRDARARNTGEYVLGRRIGRLSGLQSVEDDDFGALTHQLFGTETRAFGPGRKCRSFH